MRTLDTIRKVCYTRGRYTKNRIFPVGGRVVILISHGCYRLPTERTSSMAKVLLNSTAIPNRLIDEQLILGKLTPLENRVAIFICRKTIGWRKELDYMTQSFVANGVKSDESNISKTLNNLVKKGILTREDREIPFGVNKGKKTFYYDINEEWGNGVAADNPVNPNGVADGHLNGVAARHTREEDERGKNVFSSKKRADAPPARSASDAYKITEFYRRKFAEKTGSDPPQFSWGTAQKVARRFLSRSPTSDAYQLVDWFVSSDDFEYAPSITSCFSERVVGKWLLSRRVEQKSRLVDLRTKHG